MLKDLVREISNKIVELVVIAAILAGLYGVLGSIMYNVELKNQENKLMPSEQKAALAIHERCYKGTTFDSDRRRECDALFKALWLEETSKSMILYPSE